jgi:diguanylate cyclase (GGDEF)-like protein
MGLTEFMARQNRVVLVITALLLVAAAVVIDFASVPQLESSVFYLVPISFITWFLGRRNGLIVSVICAATAVAIRRTSPPNPRSGIADFNALAWLAVYVFFVLVISELKNLYDRERSWSRTDSLTGIPNRRAFIESLERENDRARRYNRVLTLAYVDLDHFKEINDKSGHHEGDKLLSVVGKTMKREVRKIDVVARLGGDEFAILLPETDASAATVALEKLCCSLELAMKEMHWPVTFSIGVVTFQHPPGTVQEMINAADEAMYFAKNSGRGRVVIRLAA